MIFHILILMRHTNGLFEFFLGFINFDLYEEVNHLFQFWHKLATFFED